MNKNAELSIGDIISLGFGGVFAIATLRLSLPI